ncbi:MAG: threonine ammonia-lyase, biosynthetic [Gammaproteobacteria bacterium]|nr:threonine ammonia-lyase, biosynthetic [Gammaproteobacteria bacterium]
MKDDYLTKILNARVYEVARETPLDDVTNLSRRFNNHISLKREDLQPVFSFKCRGAYNKIAHLSQSAQQKGVITASAGNHAQGVALAAEKLGIHALIVMPKTTPRIKVESVVSYGAQIDLVGNTYDEAYQHACKLALENGMTYVHPYDDKEVIAGQGTIAVEILRQHSGDIYAIFIPVGGGGLIAGMAVYIKQLHPEIKVIGVEPDDAACLYRALEAGERVILDQVGIFADGVAVQQVGEEPFRIAKEHVDEVILVNTDEICAAIKDIFDDTRSVAEPAGALAVAGLKKYVEREKIKDKNLVAIDSGANMNFDRLRHVAERAELGEQREAIIAVTIPERPGSFRDFCEIVGQRGITEFNYRYSDSQSAHVFVGVQLEKGEQEKNELVEKLKKQNYPAIDMTDNEMAKTHVRYMVGGHAQKLENECLYRFEFPERPGALLRFLNKMGHRWNISLFHYRNQGAAYGRILIGVQVPDEEKQNFDVFLHELGYAYWDESDNPAYKLFLGVT